MDEYFVAQNRADVEDPNVCDGPVHRHQLVWLFPAIPQSLRFFGKASMNIVGNVSETSWRRAGVFAIFQGSLAIDRDHELL